MYLLLIVACSLHCRAQDPGDLLRMAFEMQSADELQKFFKQWEQRVPPHDEQTIAKYNDTLREACRVFEAFYTPKDLKAKGGCEFGTDFYDSVKYVVVQNKLYVSFADKVNYTPQDTDLAVEARIRGYHFKDSLTRVLLTKTDGRLSPKVIARYGNRFYMFPESNVRLVDSIVDFRPKINVPSAQAVYLTNDYEHTLSDFLMDAHAELGEGGIMNVARATGQSAERKKFLEQFIHIWYGHWGGYWQLLTYPEVTQIVFDPNLKYARVHFTVVYQGGEAIMKREASGWKLISSRLTWIE